MKNRGLEMKKSTRVYLKRKETLKVNLKMCENLSRIEVVEKAVGLQIELHSVQKEQSELKRLSHIQRRGELIKADICSIKDRLP